MSTELRDPTGRTELSGQSHAVSRSFDMCVHPVVSACPDQVRRSGSYLIGFCITAWYPPSFIYFPSVLAYCARSCSLGTLRMALRGRWRRWALSYSTFSSYKHRLSQCCSQQSGGSDCCKKLFPCKVSRGHLPQSHISARSPGYTVRPLRRCLARTGRHLSGTLCKDQTERALEVNSQQ